LDVIYLVAEEYETKGFPKFVTYWTSMDSDFEYVDLLDQLPNPSKIKISKLEPTFNDVFSMLPTYTLLLQFPFLK